MKNGRENRNNGNQEKGKEEKETLASSVRSQQGTLHASPKFFLGKDSGSGKNSTRSKHRHKTNSCFRDSQPWNALFLFRAKTPIRAEAAMLAHLGIEHTVGNSLGRIFHAGASRQQL